MHIKDKKNHIGEITMKYITDLAKWNIERDSIDSHTLFAVSQLHTFSGNIQKGDRKLLKQFLENELKLIEEENKKLKKLIKI